MKQYRALFIASWALVCAAGCTSDDDSTEVSGLSPEAPDTETPVPEAPSTKTVLDLTDVKTNPTNYEWFDFRPNVMKLILSGAAETEHVAILWYTVTDGAVGLHFHAKTESVYVIDGTQTDAKGVYPTGTVYFNPPGSGHQITDSSGFFILAYASPPDFAATDSIGKYSPVRIDTRDPDLESVYPFAEQGAGVRTFDAPLDGTGGLSGQLLELTSAGDVYDFTGNYLLVLEGSCVIDGGAQGPETLVVATTIEPRAFTVNAAEGSSCLALGVSF